MCYGAPHNEGTSEYRNDGFTRAASDIFFNSIENLIQPLFNLSGIP